MAPAIIVIGSPSHAKKTVQVVLRKCHEEFDFKLGPEAVLDLLGDCSRCSGYLITPDIPEDYAILIDKYDEK